MNTKRWIALFLAILMMFSLTGSAGAATSHTCNMVEFGGYRTKPTCTEGGTAIYYCSVPDCNNSEVRDVPPLGHDWGKWHTDKNATCTQKGKRHRTCNRCGEVQYDSIARKEHSYGEWVRIKEPTVNTAGFEARTCSKCGSEQQRAVYPDGTLYRGGNNNKDDVKKLQEKLNEQGYDCGKADGIFGQKTEAAVKKFQEDHGLEPDGVAWPETQDQLGASPEPDVLQTTPNAASADLRIRILSGEGPYKAGDTIALDITLINTGNVPLCLARYVNAVTLPEDGIVEYGPIVYFGSEENIVPVGWEHGTGYTYTVTESDVALGSIKFDFYGLLRQVDVPGDDGDVQTVNRSVSFSLTGDEFGWAPPTVTDETVVADIFAWKTVTSYPQNSDTGYALGETITYEIGVQNNSDVTTPCLEIYDPLHGNNEDAVVALQEYIDPHQAKTYSFSHVVNQEDIDRGYVENTAEVVWWDTQKDDWAKELTNTVVVQTVSEVSPIEIKKEEISTPANGTAYVLGETIQYRITVINHSSESSDTFDLYDIMEESDSSSGYLTDVPPLGTGESWSCEYSHIVTEEDANKGSALNLAWGHLVNDWSKAYYSEWVESDVEELPGIEDDEPPFNGIGQEIEVIKSEISTPANGSYYVADEVITYLIRIVNNSAFDMENVSLYDILNTGADPLGYLGTIHTIKVGSEYNFYHFYLVTEQDVENGVVYNQASIEFNWGGENRSKYSNWTESPAGKELPSLALLNNGEISLIKEVVSTPANGSYYTKDENILYKISVANESDQVIKEVSFYDILELPNEPTGIIGHLSILDAGQTYSILISYPVTQNDVDEGWVYNQAYISYYIDDSLSNVYSNWVSSPTGEGGTPTPPTVNFAEGKVNTPVLEGDCCSRTLDATGAYTAEHDLHYCNIHESIHRAVTTSVSEADTPEAKLLARNEARTLWTDNLNEMYQSYTDHAEGAAIKVVANEKAMFYAQLAAHEASLMLIYPDNPEIVAEKVDEMLMNKCVDMCYELHTAPEARVDSVRRNGITAVSNDSASKADCSTIILDENGNDVRYRQSLCAVHGETRKKVSRRIETATASSELYATFNDAQKLWMTDLDTMYNEWYLKATNAERGIIAADRVTFGNYLKTKVAMLGYLYPNHPENVAEVIMNEISNRTMDVCMMIQ